MKLITEEFKGRIEQKITELEAHTSVEFVPAIVQRASDYFLFRASGSIAVLIAALVALRFFPIHYPIFMELMAAAVLALLTFAGLSQDFILKLFLSESRKNCALESCALRTFVKQEIFATRDRTGVLILLSLFEQKVFLLADKGLQKEMNEQQWAELGLRLAADFNRKSPGETFFAALDLISQKLAKAFPPKAENPNELPNTLRE